MNASPDCDLPTENWREKVFNCSSAAGQPAEGMAEWSHMRWCIETHWTQLNVHKKSLSSSSTVSFILTAATNGLIKPIWKEEGKIEYVSLHFISVWAGIKVWLMDGRENLYPKRMHPKTYPYLTAHVKLKARGPNLARCVSLRGLNSRLNTKCA